MIDAIFEFLSIALMCNSYTSVFASFGWGIVSVLLSPCHLSSIPLVVGFISSQCEINIKRTFIISLVFGIGHILVIVAAGTLTKKVQQYLNWTEKSKAATYIKRICGLLVIFGGIYMIYNRY